MAKAKGRGPSPLSAPPATFAELGCNPALVTALESDSIVQPMEAQLLAWEALKDGTDTDVTLIAEAGSGKTLAYLLPLLDTMLSSQNAGQPCGSLLVVVPTHDLVSQVLRVASSVCALTTLKVSSADDPKVASKADVVVGTPKAAAELICGRTGVATRGKPVAARGTHGVDGAHRRSPQTIVFDECDFMLAGVRKTGSKAGASPAARILDAVRRSSKARGKGGRSGNGSAARTRSDLSSEDDESGPQARPHPQPVRVLFVSATVPGQGGRSVGAFLNERFPSMRWVRTGGAHRPVATLHAEFAPVADSKEARGNALVELCAMREGRTLVFANSVARANDAYKRLAAENLDAEVFHPDVPYEQRERALERCTHHHFYAHEHKPRVRLACPTPCAREGHQSMCHPQPVTARKRRDYAPKRLAFMGFGFERSHLWHARALRFRKQKLGLLVCSGLAARGIDLPEVEMVGVCMNRHSAHMHAFHVHQAGYMRSVSLR